MLLNKIIKYAKGLGVDEEDLFEMNFLDAMLKLEDAKALWRELENYGKTL